MPENLRLRRTGGCTFSFSLEGKAGEPRPAPLCIGGGKLISLVDLLRSIPFFHFRVN